MAPEDDAFLERICAAPDDDGPRLVHADWLEEQGNPRGEFVRVQCAIARLPADDPRRHRLVERESILLARHHVDWTEPLRGIAGWSEFKRGYIEVVNVEARKFLARAGDLFRNAPIRHVRFLDVGSSLSKLVDHPDLARLGAITFYAQHLNDQLVPALRSSPYLENLRSLNLARNRIGDAGARTLATSQQFRQLQSLDLSDNTLGDTGVTDLAHSHNLANLRSLELRRNELSRSGLARLGASPCLENLRHLGVALNYIGAPLEFEPPDRGIVSLESIDLCENGLTGDFLSQLIHWPGFDRLQSIDAGHNEVGNAGAWVFANWTSCGSLTTLKLPDNRIGDEGARALARSNYLHHLTHLDLSDNPIHDPGAFEFLNTSSLPRLKKLGLPHLGLTPKMRRAIVARFGG
jgi:uncharacterized protein (TIGR02996 family)